MADRKGGGKKLGNTPEEPLKLPDYSEGEGGRMRGVAMKCDVMRQNTGGEGSIPALN